MVGKGIDSEVSEGGTQKNRGSIGSSESASNLQYPGRNLCRLITARAINRMCLNFRLERLLSLHSFHSLQDKSTLEWYSHKFSAVWTFPWSTPASIMRHSLPSRLDRSTCLGCRAFSLHEEFVLCSRENGHSLADLAGSKTTEQDPSS